MSSAGGRRRSSQPEYPAGFYQPKRCQPELERYGGKANVIFDELGRWVASLWQGKTLALTLAWLSVAAALALYLLARFLDPNRPAVSSSSPRKNPTEEKDL